MLIYGKEVRDAIKAEIKKYAAVNRMHMVILQIGEDPASQMYVNGICKFADETGVDADILKLSAGNSQEQIIHIIEYMNNDPDITGIMLQKPLPPGFSLEVLANVIDPYKDVEGITNYNLGKLISYEQGIRPATPKAILTMLKAHNIPIEGKKVTILGRSTILGQPLAAMMTAENATVTICHSKTVNLVEETKRADILVAAVGKPNFVTPDMINEDVVVIDAGINFDEEGRMLGDVHPEAKEKARIASAVPGGVGLITVAELFKNLVYLKEEQIRRQREKGR